MNPSDYDASGFCVGVVDKQQIIDGSSIVAGDKIIGLSSSGFHSNGFSLIRKVLEEDLKTDHFKEYYGPLLLEPTKIYAKTILKLLASEKFSIKGMSHITGGGITENLNRALPMGLDALVDTSAWSIPYIINCVISKASLSQEEALKTFNCGIGFALIVSPEEEAAVLDALCQLGEEDAVVIGEVVAGQSPGESSVRYTSADAPIDPISF